MYLILLTYLLLGHNSFILFNVWFSFGIPLFVSSLTILLLLCQNYNYLIIQVKHETLAHFIILPLVLVK